MKDEYIKRKTLEKVMNEEIKVEVELQSPAIFNSRKLISGGILVTVLLVLTAMLSCQRIFKRDTLERLRSSGERISVAVFPFKNMTGDTIWDAWQDGVQYNLITSLSNSEDLKVRQTESITMLLQSKGIINYASVTPSMASEISQKLETNVFIFGSINKTGSRIRLNAKIIDSNTGKDLKSFQIKARSKEENIFSVIDSLSVRVKNYLLISKPGKVVLAGTSNERHTYSPEAFKYFITGNHAYMLKRDYNAARDCYMKAISIDTNLFSAGNMLVETLYNLGLYDQAKELCLNLYKKRDQMSLKEQIMLDEGHAILFETPDESIKCLEQILKIDDQQPDAHYLLGVRYRTLGKNEKALPEFENAMGIYNKWNSRPTIVLFYTDLGMAYHRAGQYEQERKLYKKAELDFQDDPAIITRQIILSFAEKDTVEANRIIEKYISVLKKKSTSEAAIATNMAVLYSEAGNLNKSEEYYRKALSLEPENPLKMNDLSYFLIRNNRNVNQALKLVDKVLALNPENYKSLHIKGWGLYQLGKYKEAQDILQKSWDIRMKNGIYDHSSLLHLGEAKKAVDKQKNN